MRILLLSLSFLLVLSQNCYSQQNSQTKPTDTKTTDKLRLYPNPAKTYSNIYVDWLQAQPFVIEIHDLQHNIKLTEIKVGTRKSYQYSLDVTQLPNGKYKIMIIGTSNMEEILTVSR